jgi:hypothetical protein
MKCGACGQVSFALWNLLCDAIFQYGCNF